MRSGGEFLIFIQYMVSVTKTKEKVVSLGSLFAEVT